MMAVLLVVVVLVVMGHGSIVVSIEIFAERTSTGVSKCHLERCCVGWT